MNEQWERVLRLVGNAAQITAAELGNEIGAAELGRDLLASIGSAEALYSGVMPEEAVKGKEMLAGVR